MSHKSTKRPRPVCPYCGHPVGHAAAAPGGSIHFRLDGHWTTAHTSCWVAAQETKEAPHANG